MTVEELTGELEWLERDVSRMSVDFNKKRELLQRLHEVREVMPDLTKADYTVKGKPYLVEDGDKPDYCIDSIEIVFRYQGHPPTTTYPISYDEIIKIRELLIKLRLEAIYDSNYTWPRPPKRPE